MEFSLHAHLFKPRRLKQLQGGLKSKRLPNYPNIVVA